MTSSEIQKTQDAAVEFAKDLLMHDFQPLLESLGDRRQQTEKGAAFLDFVATLKGARAAAEAFRVAHIEQERNGIRSQMEKDLAEELKRVDSLAPGTAS